MVEEGFGMHARMVAAALAIACIAVAMLGVRSPGLDAATTARGIDDLAEEVDRIGAAIGSGTTPIDAFAASAEALGEKVALVQEHEALLRHAVASGALDAGSVEEVVGASRARLRAAHDRLLAAALAAGTDQEDDPEDGDLPAPSLPPVPNVPLPEELDPAIDLVTPLVGEFVGRTCASSGATLALGIIVAPAVLPSVLEGLPVELPAIPVAGGDPTSAATLALRNLIAIHSIGCGYVPVADQRTMCDPDRQLLEAVPPEAAEAAALLGSPSDLVPAPAGAGVATVREGETQAGQAGTVSDPLHEALGCETRAVLGQPAGSGGSQEPVPTARPVPVDERGGVPPQPAPEVAQPAEVLASDTTAPDASTDRTEPSVEVPTQATEAGSDTIDVTGATGGGPWSWIALVAVLLVIGLTYVPRERLPMGSDR